MSEYLDFTGLQTLWGRIKEYAKITTTSGTTKVVIGANEVTIPDEISPYDSAPEMDGTASAGNSSSFARGNHVHPTDTSRVAANAAITGATKTKITYDSKGLVTGGADLSASDIPSITLSKISDVTASAAEINLLDGVTATTTELNYVDGVTSNIQTQLDNKVGTSSVGAASGVCPLDSGGKVASAYLPGYVDDVVEAYPRSGQTELSQNWLSTTSGGSALTPETGKIYVLLAASTNYAVNSEFRWGGSTYVQLNDGGLTPMTTSEIETATPLT